MIDRTTRCEQVVDALQFVDENRAKGKVLISPAATLYARANRRR